MALTDKQIFDEYTKSGKDVACTAKALGLPNHGDVYHAVKRHKQASLPSLPPIAKKLGITQLPKRYTYSRQKMVNKYDQWYGADEAKKEVFEKLSKVVNAIGEGETITREQLASVFATTLDIPSEYVKDFLEDCLEFLTHKQIKK